MNMEMMMNRQENEENEQQEKEDRMDVEDHDDEDGRTPPPLPPSPPPPPPPQPQAPLPSSRSSSFSNSPQKPLAQPSTTNITAEPKRRKKKDFREIFAFLHDTTRDATQTKQAIEQLWQEALEEAEYDRKQQLKKKVNDQHKPLTPTRPSTASNKRLRPPSALDANEANKSSRLNRSSFPSSSTNASNPSLSSASSNSIGSVHRPKSSKLLQKLTGRAP